MTRIAKLAMSAIGAVALCGCVATNVPPPARTVIFALSLGPSFGLSRVWLEEGASDFYTFQANMVNTTSSEIAVDWKVVWLDADGVAIDSVVSTWSSRMLHPHEICALKGTAPRADAVDMLFYTRRARR